MKIEIIKKETIFDLIQSRTSSSVPAAAIAEAWSVTRGFINNMGSYSNLDSYSYLEAVLADGFGVQVKTKCFSAATMQYCTFHKSQEWVMGSGILPKNWVEIRLSRFRYLAPSDKFSAPNYRNHVVARNNYDGTATVFKTAI